MAAGGGNESEGVGHTCRTVGDLVHEITMITAPQDFVVQLLAMITAPQNLVVQLLAMITAPQNLMVQLS